MSNDSYLELADRIGARICRDAIWDGGRCNWVAGRGRGGKDSHALTPSLYSGTSGIALFLRRLSEVTGEKIFRDTAVGALRQALSQTDRLTAAGDSGLYTGLAGVAYVAHEFGEPLALDLQPGPDCDLIRGAAGLLVAALRLWPLDAAIRCGDALIEAARHSAAGWSWPSIMEEAQPGRPDLLGFGHGAAGVAWALLELERATGERKYRTAAEEGFRYEQSYFSAEHGNWPDLRQRSSENAAAAEYSAMWCHGAAGIAFSRLRAAEITGDPLYREQAEAALKVVERELPKQGSCCLCHGLFGSIDLLLYANHPEPAHDAARDAIDRYPAQRLPWPCGVPEGHETPDLMLGLAGIGHTLLRLRDPAAFPSPLMIAPT